MDLSKAFDMANHILLEAKLRKKGIKGKVLNAIKTLNNDMRAVATANGKISQEFKIERGTAQGCPLSPTLFDIYIDDLVQDLQKCQHGIQHTPVLAYADDVLVMADTPEKLQEMIKICHDWTCKWRMKANTIKSQTMQWLPNHNPNEPRPDCNMKFGDANLKCVRIYKYLGVHLDDELTFNEHFKKKLVSAKRKLGLVYPFINDDHVPRNIKEQLANAVILGGSTYGLQYWGADRENELEELLREVSLTLAKVRYKSRVSTEAAIAIAGLKPINIRLKQAAKKQLDQISKLPDERLSKGVWTRDFRPDSLKSKYSEFPSKENEVKEICRQQQLGYLHRIRQTHKYTHVGSWDDSKEGESGRTRNEIRCGCDALSLETKRLREDHNEVPHCPMCRQWNSLEDGNNTGIPLHHPYTDCENTQGELMSLLEIIRLKNGDRYIPGFPRDTFKDLLTPANWNTQSNKLINNWCKTINQYYRTALCKTVQPSLAALINPDEPNPLSNNIVGEVFTADFGAPINGKYTIRVRSYDMTSDTFEIDSVGLDINLRDSTWLFEDGIKLNEIYKNGCLRHIPSEEVINLYDDPESVLNGHIYDNNVLGRTIELTEPDQQQHKKYLITGFEKARKHYKHEQWKLSGRPEFHTLQRPDGSTLEVDLNKLHAEGKVRHPVCLHTALTRLRGGVHQRSRSLRREVDAERYGRSTK